MSEENNDEKKFLNEWRLESFKATLEYGRMAVRGIVVLNGGSAIAVMTFLGHASGSDKAAVALPIALAMVKAMGWFVAGAFCGVTTAFISYLSQGKYTQLQDEHAIKWQAAAIITGCLSMVLFALGCLAAYNQLLALK